MTTADDGRSGQGSEAGAGDPAGPTGMAGMGRHEIEAVLARTEQLLDPADPERGAGVTVLGYGEVSAALTIDGLPGLVCKRMSGFSDPDAAARYVDLVTDYLAELTSAGIVVVPTLALPIARPAGHTVVHLVQPEQAAATVGNRLLGSTDDAGLAAAVRGTLECVATLARHTAERTDGLEVALDGQLSNWAFPCANAAADPRAHPTDAASPTEPPGPTEPPSLFDVGTPFMRRAGKHSMSRAYLLGPVPPGLRTYYGRKGLVEAYLDDYFVPRTVALDLLGNFHKEGRADRLPVAIDVVNQWLAEAGLPGPSAPIDLDEVATYYRKDADLLELYLRLRRMDRFVRTKVLRRPYDYLLPGRVTR